MQASVRALIALAISAAAGLAQAPANEPTKEEIARAYRSKSGGAGTIVPGVQWERWRIREIRGWKLHFRQTGRTQSPGILTMKYGAVAKKNGLCASYQITDTMPFPPTYPEMKPILVVDPNGVSACR